MGNQSNFLDDFTICQVINSQIFGKLVEVRDSSHQIYYAKLYWCHDESELCNGMDIYQKRKNLNLQNLLQIKGVIKSNKKMDCTTGPCFYVVFQKCQMNIDSLIGKFLKQNKIVQQQKVWQYISSLVQTLSKLYKHSLKNIYVTTKTLLFSADLKMKIIDNLLSKQRHPYFKVSEDVKLNQHYYLPPQSIKSIEIGRVQPSITIKSDFYAIGIVLLQLVCRDNLRSCYCPAKNIILTQKISKKLEEGTGYSTMLKNLLISMIQQKIQFRIDYQELVECLSNHYAFKASLSLSDESFTTARRGIKMYSQQQFYQGHIIDNRRQGYGQLFKGDKLVYRGYFFNNKFHGMGTFLYNNVSNQEANYADLRNQKAKIQYLGDFQNGSFDGFGVLQLKGGKYYGNFKKGQADGLGRFKDDSTNLQIVGKWKKGIFYK